METLQELDNDELPENLENLYKHARLCYLEVKENYSKFLADEYIDDYEEEFNLLMAHLLFPNDTFDVDMKQTGGDKHENP